jgi:adenylate cyclase
MPHRRTRTEVRVSLAVVPVQEGGDLLGPAVRVFAGLSTWIAVSRVTAGPTQTPADLQRIAGGARYVLHGWTERERGRMRLTLELNETESGRVLWSDRLDRPVTEREALREDAAVRIGQAIGPVLLRRELDRTALEAPDALTAQDLALRAFDAIMQPRRGEFLAAAGALARAEATGGDLAGTRFAMVWWHLMAISQGWGGNLAHAAALAGQLDGGDPAAAALRIYVDAVQPQGYAAAKAGLDLVLDNASLCGVAGCLKALTMCWLGDAHGAIGYAEQACEVPALGPERAWREHVTALAYYVAGRYDDAVRWARLSAARHPVLAANVRVLAAGLAVLGRLDEAQHVATQVLVIDPAFRISTWRERSLLPGDCLNATVQRLRLAGLPG